MFVAPTVSAVAETFVTGPTCSSLKTATPAVKTRQSTAYVSVCFWGKLYPAAGGCSAGACAGSTPPRGETKFESFCARVVFGVTWGVACARTPTHEPASIAPQTHRLQ